MYKKFEMELAGRTLRVDVDRVAKSKRPPLKKRTSENGRTETWTACIPEKSRYRKIPCFDRKTWIKKIIHENETSVLSVCPADRGLFISCESNLSMI